MTGIFEKSILSNGIRVLSEKMEGTRAVSLGIWVETGSRFDPPDQTGVAHFIEHMLFKGTENRNAFEIAESLESLGGHLNAFTEKEMTAYYAHVLDQDVAEAVDVLSDVLLNPVMDEADIRNEQQIVLEEIQSLEDTPEDYVQDLFLQQMFRNHALGTSILGDRETIPRISRQILLDFKQLWYTGKRLIITCAGNVDHKILADLIQQAFHKLPAGNDLDSGQSREVSTCFEEIHRQPASQVHYCTGTRGVPYSDKRRYSLICLNTLIGGCMSSRLFQRLREKQGLAYSVFSMLDFWSDAGLWGIYAGTSPSQKTSLMTSVEDELEKIRQGDIESTELERIKNQLLGNLILSMEETSNRMDRLARMEFHTGTYLDVDTITENIRKVTLEHLIDTAKWLLDQPFYTTIIEPHDGTDRRNH